ncbi:MAG: TrkH family potassium uptake protein [Dysgonamonadaceae bacterium]|jgi:trk system potassium uptake protein TrkH|nr:TrkH family potassium uptake protein [Dysgonamonadaceae bacterium]
MKSVNWKFVFRVTGLTLMLESVFMFFTAGVSFYLKEAVEIFILSGIITLSAGWALFFFSDFKTKFKIVEKKESCLSVTFAWISFAVFGALPFLLSGQTGSFTDAVFESTSGITTTGASILNNVESLPASLLFWRSLIQWMGGLGIIVFSLALFPLMGGGAAYLFDSETTGLTHDKFRPRVNEMALRLLLIYVSLTGVMIVLLIAGAMSAFDAVCHAFSTISTGGFSSKGSNLAYWDSVYIETVTCVFMLTGATNFALLYFLFKGKIKKFFCDEELRWFAAIILVTGSFIAVCLQWGREWTHIADSVRIAFFRVISVITGTGFSTGDSVQWSPAYWIPFMFLMFVCGCAGSTSGGMKVIRVVVLIKNTFHEFKRMTHPRAVIPVRINGETLSFETVQRLLAFAFLYLLIIFVSWGILVCSGMTFMEALVAALSSLGNTGLGFAETGPSGSFAGISAFAKWYMAFLMVVGRVEIFTVLILFIPAFWKN